jgi:hypothetical protein
VDGELHKTGWSKTPRRAEYHCANINAEIQRLRKLAKQSSRRSSLTQGGMFMFGEQQKIAYELDAFLAAARSCIDFVAGMIALHLGMEWRTSIKPC